MGIEPTRDRMNRLSTALKAVDRTSVPSASVRAYTTPSDQSGWAGLQLDFSEKRSDSFGTR